MLQVSDIAQYFYCQRKIYFMKILGINIKSRPKMDMGKEEHDNEHRRITERKTIYGFDRVEVKDVIHNLALEDAGLGLYGVVDTTLVLKNGEIIPIDVKYSNTTTVRINWKKQLVAYSLLLESHYNKIVKMGVIYLPAQRRQIQIDITVDDKNILKQDMLKINKLIESEKMPNAIIDRKCNYCEMKKFCC